MDQKQIAAEATGAAVALSSSWKVWRWFFPKKDGSESIIKFGLKAFLCKMDEKIDKLSEHFLTHMEGEERKIESIRQGQERLNTKLDRLADKLFASRETEP